MTTPQTTVSHSAPPPVAPPAAAPPAQNPPVDGAALQRQIDELKTAMGEKDRAIEFWQEKASTKAAPPEAKKPEAEEEDPDLLDVVTTGGVKGLEKILEKKGFIRAADVDAKVNAKAEALVQEQQLLKDYPDLADKTSEFFKTTALHYGNLLKANVAPSVAMQMAAERTELALIREGKIKTPQQKKEEREAERRARISAQGGDRGVRQAQESEEDEELTAEQKHIARSMGISEEAYKARAKKGVAMRGTR